MVDRYGEQLEMTELELKGDVPWPKKFKLSRKFISAEAWIRTRSEHSHSDRIDGVDRVPRILEVCHVALRPRSDPAESS